MSVLKITKDNFEAEVLNKAIQSLKEIDAYICEKIEKYESTQEEKE